MEGSSPASREEKLELGTTSCGSSTLVEGHEKEALAPQDGGKKANMTAIGCFLLETVVWSLPFAYGVLQQYFSTHEPFRKDSATTAAISTTSIGLMYICSPFSAWIVQRWPWMRFRLGLLGLAIMDAALIGASFCSTAIVLLLTLGVLYAAGGLILYFPAMILIDEWFERRKSEVFAAVWSGTYIGGAALPFLLHWLLHTYGFRTTLRTWSVVLTVVTFPSLLMMSNRLPTSRSRTGPKMDFTFLKQPMFWLYNIPSTVQSFATFLPLIWLPSFAADIGLPSFAGPLALALANFFIGVGFIAHGRITDRYGAVLPIAISTIGGMISIFLFWGFATNQAMLYTFAVSFGLTAGCFPANWPGCAKDMRRRCPNLDTGFVISLLCACRGLGSVCSGFIGAGLYKMEPWNHLPYAYGTQYGSMIVFTGILITLGGAGCIARIWIKS